MDLNWVSRKLMLLSLLLIFFSIARSLASRFLVFAVVFSSDVIDKRSLDNKDSERLEDVKSENCELKS